MTDFKPEGLKEFRRPRGGKKTNRTSVAYLEDGAGDCGRGAGVDGGAVGNVEGDDAGGGGGGDGGGGSSVALDGCHDANGSGVDDYGSGFSGDDVGCGSGVGVDGGADYSDDGGGGIGCGDDNYDSGVGGDYDVGRDVDHQCGFRRNRSTTDHMFCIRQILEKKWEYNKAVHQLFIDFEKDPAPWSK